MGGVADQQLKAWAEGRPLVGRAIGGAALDSFPGVSMSNTMRAASYTNAASLNP